MRNNTVCGGNGRLIKREFVNSISVPKRTSCALEGMLSRKSSIGAIKLFDEPYISRKVTLVSNHQPVKEIIQYDIVQNDDSWKQLQICIDLLVKREIVPHVVNQKVVFSQ